MTNFQGQLSLNWLFSEPEEKTPVLCDHSEIKATSCAFLFANHVPSLIPTHTQLKLVLFVVFCDHC